MDPECRSLTVNSPADTVPETSKFSGIIRMPILSATALKGGTGKTVLCQMLAGAFALTGRRILAIDNDPQSSLSTGMLGTDAEQIHPDNTIAAIYSGLDPLPSDVIRPSGIPGVDLIPGSRAADSFNLPDPHLATYDVQGRLRSFLDEARGVYELTIVDNPPNLYAATYAALVAADYCLVPATPENYGVSSISPVLEVVRQVVEGPNPGLVNLGIVLTKIERTGTHVAFEQMLREIHGSLIFDARIAKAADIPEAIVVNKPVTHYKPRGASAKAFKALAEEILTRIVANESPALVEAADGQV
jgi:chromosome partitioning protein